MKDKASSFIYHEIYKTVERATLANMDIVNATNPTSLKLNLKRVLLREENTFESRNMDRSLKVWLLKPRQ